MFERWIRRIAESIIVESSDGRKVFYPFGPFKGYVLSKAAFEPIIIKSIVWFNLSALASFAVAAGICAVFKLSTDVLLIAGILDFVGYYFRFRRVARKLVPLPQRLSIRFYAMAQDEDKMWQRLVSIVMMVIMCGVFVFVGVPSTVFLVGLAIALAWGIVWAYVVFLHYQVNGDANESNDDAPSVQLG